MSEGAATFTVVFALAMTVGATQVCMQPRPRTRADKAKMEYSSNALRAVWIPP